MIGPSQRDGELISKQIIAFLDFGIAILLCHPYAMYLRTSVSRAGPGILKHATAPI